MDLYEESRKTFLKKLGLTVGASILASSRLSAVVLDQKESFQLNPEMQDFMDKYEGWMDEFIEVIRIQKVNPDDFDNNMNLVRLSNIAKEWQPKLTEYMKDENFARYYMVATERMTQEI